MRRASTVQSPPSMSAESTTRSLTTPLLLDRSAETASPHLAPPLPHAAACSQTPPHTQDTLDHLVAEQTPGGLNEQVPSLDSQRRRMHRAGYALSCTRAMSAMSACCTVFRRCSANSPRQERTKPFPTRSTALLRAFSNGKRPSSRRAPTPQRLMEVAIDYFRRELRGSSHE